MEQWWSRKLNINEFCSRAIEFILGKIHNRQWLVDEKKDDGFTALQLAALNDHCLVAELLLKKGNAAINGQNISLQTALHLAVGPSTRANRQCKTKSLSRSSVEHRCSSVSASCSVLTMPMSISQTKTAIRAFTKLWDITHCLSWSNYKTWETRARFVENPSIATALLREVWLIFQMMNIFSNAHGYDKRPSVMIADTLVMHGADLSLRNKKNKTPFDLCPDPHLCRMLTQTNM